MLRGPADSAVAGPSGLAEPQADLRAGSAGHVGPGSPFGTILSSAAPSAPNGRNGTSYPMGSRPGTFHPGDAGEGSSGAGEQGRPRTRKLTIKPFKEKPKLPDGFEEATWSKVREAVVAIYEKRAVSCSLEELYRAVESMCMHKMAAGLYSRLEAECEKHIAAQLAQLQLKAGTMDPTLFLTHVAAAWDKHSADMLLIRSIALYLDRTYVLQTQGVQSLWDMGLRLFRKHLEAGREVQDRTVAGLLKLIEMERNGESIDRSVLKRLLEMLLALGLYSSCFLKPLLDETAEYYAAASERLMATADVRDFLRRAEVWLQEEHERCTLCLDVPSTRKPLLAVVERQLLARHASAIIEKGFNALMDANQTEDLQRLFVLMQRVGALDVARTALVGYIKSVGQGLVMDEEKDKDLVQSMLDLKARVDHVWEHCFQQQDAFANAIKDAFEYLINLRQNRPAELIAKFIDAKLRAGNKGTSDEELEGTLDKVLVLFRFIQGKDVFEAFYKKDLAKRLLFGRSASVDAEKSMISKLKTECGSQFTNKLEGMFKDIELSNEINESFRVSATARSRLPQGIEMSVNVLKMGFWPTYPAMDVQLPPELSAYQDVFKEFYVAKHSGRRLMWQNSLGQCVLRAEFPKGRKELSVSLFQAVVLMLFNTADTLTLAEIRDASGITADTELRRTLQSLACGKTRVLQKIPKGRDVEDGDSFEFNKDFSAQLYRIKVNAIQMKETVEENASTTERVFQDRQYQVDAAIVRIMKTRKVLSHTLLITELFQQLKFPVKPADLKKRIESLIDREYMERDKSNPQVYNYVA